MAAFVRRWRPFLIASAIVLTPFWLLYAVYKGWTPDQPDWAVIGIAAPTITGIDLGLALAGLWSPSSSQQPSAAPGPWVAPQPFGALIRATLPLILPVLIVVVAGTADDSVLVQIVVGALAGWLAWTVIVRAEVRRLTRWTLLAAGVLVAAYAIAALISNAATDPILGSFRDRGGWPSVLLRGAVVLWAAAIILRLASFATSCVRMLQAVLLAGAIGCVAVWAGVIAAPGWLSHNALAAAGAFSLGTLVVLIVDALAGIVGVVFGRAERVRQLTATSGALSNRAASFSAGFGLAAALLASAALGGAALVGLEETGHHGHPRLTATGEVITAGEPATAPGQELPASPHAFPAKLARTYIPELAFRHDELWLPERVNGFVRDASLEGPPGTASDNNTLKNLPRSCPGGAPAPCFRLTINCKMGTEPCAHGQALDDEHPLGDPARTGTVYVRVVTKDEAPKLFPNGVGEFGDQAPTILIEYWYFYRYDEWTTPVLTGRLVQRHEGDWEAVIIGLSQKEPLYVAYSQHCGGEWLPWTSAPVADTSAPRTHPLVAVARGSHANYPDPEQGHAPDWAGCSGAKLPRGSASLLSYASNIRDFTGYDYGWEPPDSGIINAQPQKPPMSFPGYWGSNGLTQLVNERPHTLATGGEPKSPPLQFLWFNPLNTVFCSNWRYPAHIPLKCPPK